MVLLQDYQQIHEQNSRVYAMFHNNKMVWPDKKIDPAELDWFYVENISSEDETLSIVKKYSWGTSLTIEYSTDKTTWQTLGTTSDTGLTRTLAPGDKVYLRCNTTSWRIGYVYNMISGTSKIGGNIMSLLYGSGFRGQETSFPSGSTYTFYHLFDNNTRLIDISELLLPATTLAGYCYSNMFGGCTSLTAAPALPATTLAGRCYDNMFSGCTSLTATPELPAVTLTDYCYSNMFSGCTSLNNVTCLAISGVNENSSTLNWLSNVSSTGTFIKATGVNWPTGESGIPSGWTVVEE